MDASLTDLISQVQNGDEEAARSLLARLYPLVRRLVRSHLPNRTSEDDLCQVVFVRIFQNLGQYAGKAPFEHWVSRVAINTCIKQIKAERIRPELRYADLSEQQMEVVEQLASSTAEVRDENRAAAGELLGELLRQLVPQDRLVLTLLHFEERSVEEIKAITGWSGALVKVRAFRARRKLKKMYERLLSQKKHD